MAEPTAKINEPSEEPKVSDSESDEESIPEGYDGPYKMVFVVNTELGMGVGKIAAQVGHATLGLYRTMLDQENPKGNITEQVSFWEDVDGEKKIALKGDSAQHLLDLESIAIGNGLPCYVVQDAGHTQVMAGSITVLSIFGRDCDVNEVTGKLKLL